MTRKRNWDRYPGRLFENDVEEVPGSSPGSPILRTKLFAKKEKPMAKKEQVWWVIWDDHLGYLKRLNLPWREPHEWTHNLAEAAKFTEKKAIEVFNHVGGKPTLLQESKNQTGHGKS